MNIRNAIAGGLGVLIGVAYVFCPLPAGSAPQSPDYRKEHYHLYVARLLDSDLVIMDSVTKEEIGRIEFGPGANPVDIVPSPDLSRLYVSLRGHNEVAVIDTKNRKLETRIKVGKHPHFIKVLPDGKRLIVANNSDTHASIIDMGANAVVAKPEVTVGSAGVAVTPDGKFAYIMSVYTGNITVIDLEKAKRVETINVPGEFPYFLSVAVPPGSPLIYICTTSRNSISVWDTRTNKVVGEFPTARYPSYITLAPGGDTRTNKVVGEFPTARYPSYITLAPGGARAFVTHTFSNYSESVTVVDLHKRAVIKEIKVGQMPMVPVVSPDGKFLFTANYGVRDEDGTISVVDMDTLAEVERIRFWRVPQAIAVVPAR